MKGEELLAEYSRVLELATSIVRKKDSQGENEFLPLEGYFPHGSQDLSFLLYMKILRVLGMEKVKGTLEERLEEAIDILNYAAFYVILASELDSGKGDE